MMKLCHPMAHVGLEVKIAEIYEKMVTPCILDICTWIRKAAGRVYKVSDLPLPAAVGA